MKLIILVVLMLFVTGCGGNVCTNSLKKAADFGNYSCSSADSGASLDATGTSGSGSGGAWIALGETGSLTVDAGSEISFQMNGYDSESSPTYTFSCTFGCSHPGMSFDTSTGVFDWTPGWTDSGTYNMSFQVTDGAMTTGYSLTVTVSAVNLVPTFTNLAAQSIGVGDDFTLVPNATEPEGNPITYYLVSALPANATWDGTTLTFNPQPGQDGGQIWEFDFQASDGTNAGTGSLFITVN